MGAHKPHIFSQAAIAAVTNRDRETVDLGESQILPRPMSAYKRKKAEKEAVSSQPRFLCACARVCSFVFVHRLHQYRLFQAIASATVNADHGSNNVKQAADAGDLVNRSHNLTIRAHKKRLVDRTVCM